MRIVEIETVGHGGLAHYAFNLSVALLDRGHQVTLVTASDYELAARAAERADLELLRPIARRSAWGHGGRPGARGRLLRKVEAVWDAIAVARLCRRLRPDLVHLHCNHPIALLYLQRLRGSGIPIVYTAHVVRPHEPVAFEASIYRRIHRLADLVVAHSAVDRDRLCDESGLDRERIAVLPHGEYGFFLPGDTTATRRSARAALGIREDERVALFCGYSREYKGLDGLLDAGPAVAAEVPAARLVVVGDPVRLTAPRRQSFERSLATLGAIHRLEYVPFDEVGRYFALADALVMPYRRISQSGVLFLALASGLPIVATAVGALPEMLRNGESALLVPPESPGELARALSAVLSRPDLAARLSAGGRRVARDHSWPSIAGRTEEAFSRLLARQPR